MAYRFLLITAFMAAILLAACGQDEASTETPSPTLLSPKEYLDLGIEHQNAEEYSSAVADFTSAIEAGLEGVEAHWRRGLSYFELARFPQVVEDLSEVTAREFDGLKDRTLTAPLLRRKCTPKGPSRTSRLTSTRLP